MTQKTTLLIILGVALVAILAFVSMKNFKPQMADMPLDPTPQNMTISGTYVCLPHLDTTGPQTQECAFGLQADSGEYYAVNFGQSADAMEQFRSGAHITAEGFIIIKEALSTDQWNKYNMKGMFTVTRIIGETGAQGKIDINAVCDGALAYMTFPDGESAATFVAECKEGKHPEVIEQYKTQMGLGDGAQI